MRRAFWLGSVIALCIQLSGCNASSDNTATIPVAGGTWDGFPAVVNEQTKQPKGILPPKEIFARRDLDRSGTLTRDEFLANRSDKDASGKRFMSMDVNRDEQVDLQEFMAKHNRRTNGS
jgi:hypothetical protein